MRISGVNAATTTEWNKFRAAVQNAGVVSLPSEMALAIRSPNKQDQIIGRRVPDEQELPEPAALALAALGLLAAVAARRKVT